MINNPSIRKKLLENRLTTLEDDFNRHRHQLVSTDLSEKQKLRLASFSFGSCIGMIDCVYSLGLGKASMVSYLILACDLYPTIEVSLNIKKVLGLEIYQDHLFLFCFAYLFDLEQTYWDKIVNHWLSLELEDSLILGIIAKRNPELAERAWSQTLQQPKWFEHASAALFASSSDKQLTELNAHLFRWYTSRKLCAWYDAHKRPDRPVYGGYWSVESAAIVKALNLEVDEISLGRYFPAGLLDPSGNPQRVRVFYPLQDELCFIVSRDWKDESEERLSLLSPNGLLEVAGTLYSKGENKLADFIATRHESTLKNLPWYSLQGKPSKVKTSIRVAEKYVYQGIWPNEQEPTISEHYLLGIGSAFLALSFNYLTKYTGEVEGDIQEVLMGIEV